MEGFEKALQEQGYEKRDGDTIVETDVELVSTIAAAKQGLTPLIETGQALLESLERIEVVKSLDPLPLSVALPVLGGESMPEALSFLQEPARSFREVLTKAVSIPNVPQEKSFELLRAFTGQAVNKFYSEKEEATQALEERFVLGVVLEPTDGSDGHPVKPDTDGDIYSPEEVRKAAHWYMEHGRKKGLLHGPKNGGEILAADDPRIVVLECCVTWIDTPPFTFGPRQEMMIKKGSWLMAFRINDDAVWADIKAGDLNGLSIGGVSDREELI